MRRATKSGFLFSLACLAMASAASIAIAAGVAPEKAKESPDGKTLWYDCKDLVVEGKGWSDTLSAYDRLPAKAQDKVRKPVWELSRNSAGLCVRFMTDAPTIEVRWTLSSAELAMPHMPATGVSGVDLYVKNKDGQWRFARNGRPMAVSNKARFKLPGGQQYLLYLPLYNGVKSLEIGIPKGQTLSQPDVSARKPIAFYGTSITQGGCASRPGMAAAAIVGRRLDTPVINLGFSANGRMEPEMADLLAELDPSVFVLDCVWNITHEQISNRVEPFVKRLRQSHPNTPILLAEDSNVENISPTASGRLLRAVFDKLTAEGVKNLYYLSNKDMLGDDGEGTVDGCHHNDLGMIRQAEVFVKALSPLLKKGN